MPAPGKPIDAMTLTELQERFLSIEWEEQSLWIKVAELRQEKAQIECQKWKISNLPGPKPK